MNPDPANEACARFRALLSPAHDDALSPREALALARHLEECGPCREARARLHEAIAYLRATPLVAVSSDFLERLDARLDREAALKADTLPRAELDLAGSPTLLAPVVPLRRRLVRSLQAAAVLLCVASSTFLFLEALERRRPAESGERALARLDSYAPAPEPSMPAPSLSPGFVPTPEPIDRAGDLSPATAVTPQPIEGPPAIDPRELIPRDPIVGPDGTPEPVPQASSAPPLPEPGATPAFAPPPETRTREPVPTPRPLDVAALDRLLAGIFVDASTPADQRPNLVAALAEFPHKKSYDGLARILAGELDRRPFARECRAAAYGALGTLGTEEAARVLLAVRSPDETRLLLALANMKAPRAVVWLSARVADHPDEDGRILVARALGRGGRPEALAGLAKVLASASQPPLVRAEAARALGGLGLETAIVPLERALATARIPAVRGAAARALGALAARGIAAAARSLPGALARDGHPYVREACALALGQARDATALRPLVDRLDPKLESSRRVRSAAGEALALVTGERRTLEEWRRELAKGGMPPARQGPVLALPRADWESELASGEGTVFLVDRSGSMGQDGKIDRAKEIVSDAIDRLVETARDPGARGFSIVCFADTPVAFFPRLVEPSPENVSRAKSGLARQRAWTAPTDILRAIRSALSIEGADALVLVTDGVPTLGVRDPEQLLLEVAKENAARGARIHVVALESGADAFEIDDRPAPPEAERPELSLLRRLALDNGGVFVKN
jgi:HEAT repeat protein